MTGLPIDLCHPRCTAMPKSTGLSITLCHPSMICEVFLCDNYHLLFLVVSKWQTWPNHDSLRHLTVYSKSSWRCSYVSLVLVQLPTPISPSGHTIVHMHKNRFVFSYAEYCIDCLNQVCSRRPLSQPVSWTHRIVRIAVHCVAIKGHQSSEIQSGLLASSSSDQSLKNLQDRRPVTMNVIAVMIHPNDQLCTVIDTQLITSQNFVNFCHNASIICVRLLVAN